MRDLHRMRCCEKEHTDNMELVHENSKNITVRNATRSFIRLFFDYHRKIQFKIDSYFPATESRLELKFGHNSVFIIYSCADYQKTTGNLLLMEPECDCL